MAPGVCLKWTYEAICHVPLLLLSSSVVQYGLKQCGKTVWYLRCGSSQCFTGVSVTSRYSHRSPGCMQELNRDDKAPPEWLGEIEPTFLSYEAVPILKFPFFNEVPFSSNITCTASAAITRTLHPKSCPAQCEWLGLA